MITKDLFIDMIHCAESFEQEVDRWGDFGIEVYELPIGEIPWEMFTLWAKSHFDDEGHDWISWYLWERKSINTHEVLPCYHEDGTKFYVNTPDDLWDLVKDHRLKPCLDSPCTFSGMGQCTGL